MLEKCSLQSVVTETSCFLRGTSWKRNDFPQIHQPLGLCQLRFMRNSRELSCQIGPQERRRRQKRMKTVMRMKKMMRTKTKTQRKTMMKRRKVARKEVGRATEKGMKRMRVMETTGNQVQAKRRILLPNKGDKGRYSARPGFSRQGKNVINGLRVGSVVNGRSWE